MIPEKFWYCPACRIEVNLEHPEIKLIQGNKRRAVILMDGRVHSIVKMTREVYERRMQFENNSLSATHYERKKEKPEELEGEK